MTSHEHLLQDPLAQIALIGFFSIAAQWLGWRIKVPAIVFLLLSGFVFGSVLGIIQPEILLGDALTPIVSASVAIILFEGALTLDFKEIKQGRKIVKQIVIIGGPIAWVLTAIAGHYLGGLSWEVAIPFGALLIVTGPTVIMPLLRHARLNTKVGSVLKWEGIVNDPVGAVLAILAYEYFKISKQTGMNLTEFALETGVLIIIISVISVIAGYLISAILNRGYVPEFLKSTFMVAVVVCGFSAANFIVPESGLIAVTILGVVMANKDITSIEDLRRFKESITIILVSGLFIILTAQIKPDILFNIDWRGIAFIFAVLFIIRPISVLLASIGTELNWKEVILVGTIAPRGVVCAAIAGIMGPSLAASGYPDGEKLLPLAFAIVIATVFLHGLIAKPLGQKLGLAFAAKDGLIIVGAMKWTTQLAEVLKERDLNVMIADKNWRNLKQARLNDIPIYYGEILSDETEHNLELNKYNTVLAATGNPAYNALVCNSFAHDFSRERVFQLSTNDEDEHESRKITHTMRGRTLAYEGMDCWDFESLFNQGWRFKTTRISKNFNLEEILKQKAEGKTRLFGFVTISGKLTFYQAENHKNIKEDSFAILFTNQTDSSKKDKK